MLEVAEFENHLWETQIVDPERVHSEFSQQPVGMHGQKVDFGKIVIGSPLFDEWVDITARTIYSLYPADELPRVLLAVAKGTNPLVEPVAAELGKKVVGLPTEKVDGIPMPTAETYRCLQLLRPDLLLVLDDVGTTGRNASMVAHYGLKAGANYTEVLFTWQRQERLHRLLETNIVYHSVIKHLLPTFTPEDCRTLPEGLCSQGWRLNPYKAA